MSSSHTCASLCCTETMTARHRRRLQTREIARRRIIFFHLLQTIGHPPVVLLSALGSSIDARVAALPLGTLFLSTALFRHLLIPPLPPPISR